VQAEGVTWALLDYNDVESFRVRAHQGILLSVDKVYGHQDFWATLLKRAYLDKLASNIEGRQ
jgi:hypothetical protein